ncbi:hypothetical protein QFC22_006743 [Naganishia vaughanmartiniae]|uniref:Uncharacterized protein n=1 Tax=Naganishia vaughanmartiniae TaxID=1424756 RepID=A0ACC2WGW5_9TREE|nr:hypothetical protein QFC22_006743 [Naganishia vaughanmartiniae]
MLIRPPGQPSKLESLPTEILVQIAQDAHVNEETPIHGDGSTRFGNGRTTVTRGHVGVTEAVKALGGTSRRLRAVLVHAGFFRTIELQGYVDELFPASIVATDGFLDNVEIVILRLAYRGPPDAPIDTANLRRVLDLYTGAKHINLAWNTSLVTSPPEILPQLPPTRPTAPSAPKRSNLQIRADTGERFARHLCQLLPVVVTPSLKELDLLIAFFDTGFGVQDGLSVCVNPLEGVQQLGLKRLGITGFYDLNSRKEGSQKWLSTVEKLLMLAPQISATITDLEVIITVRFNSSGVFTRAPTTDASSLPGLSPVRHEVVEMLHRVAKANIKIIPFSIGITSETTLLLVSTTLFRCDYISALYNTPEASGLLPKRMHVGDMAKTTRLVGPPETRRILGGDDLRSAVNHAGIEDVYVDVVGMEQMRHLVNMPLAADRGFNV